MQKRRAAFTLIEVLVSIMLLSLVLLALYNSVAMLRKSNIQLFHYLEKADKEKQGTEILFLDIAGSDGNLTIAGDEFSRLCLESTINTLHELPSAKVCWVVAKKNNALLRSEGNGYTLPLGSEDHVAVDAVMENVDLFRVYKGRSELLVLLRQKGKEAISFMVQGVPKPYVKKKPKKKAPKKAKPRKRRPKKRPGQPQGTPGKSNTPPAPAQMAPDSL